MGLSTVPWATGNGALNSVELARAVAHMAVKGETGVGAPDHMRVTALPTPGAAVRVPQGVVSMENKYPNVFGQMYVAMEDSSTDVPIPATGSTGGAVRYVIARVDDPTQGGQQPEDPATGPYCRYAVVSSITGLSYPHAVLARINQPANTGTITNAMITDMRHVAVPRTKQVLRFRTMGPADDVNYFLDLQNATAGGEVFPNMSEQDMEVPDWAVQAQVEVEWQGVYVEPGTDAFGEVWAVMGPNIEAPGIATQEQRWNANTNVANGRRINQAFGGNIDIPESVRGTVQRFFPRARYNSASTHKTGVSCDSYTTLKWRITFNEVPERSTL